MKSNRNFKILGSKEKVALADKVLKIYEEIESGFKPEDSGKYVIIDPETKKWFKVNNEKEASFKAEEVFPGIPFFTLKIGELITESIL